MKKFKRALGDGLKQSLKCGLMLGVFSLAVSPVGQAIAAEADSSSVQKTREVVISATKTERDKFEVPNSVNTVTEKEMRRNQAITIADQLKDIPGVEVTDGGMGGGAKRISIRGEAPSRVLILIDGMKISEQKSMDGSMIMIDPLNIERIEVLKGPASVLYGSEAIGGVVNVITKKGGDRPIQGSVSVTYDGSNDSFTPTASVYGRVGGFGYRVSGDYTDAGDRETGSGTLKNSGFTKHNISGYLDYNWEKATLAFGADQYWNDIEIPGSTMDGGGTIDMGLPRWSRNRYYTRLEVREISDTLQQVTASASLQQTVKKFWNEMHPMPMMPKMSVNPVTRNDQDYYNVNLQTDWTFGDNHYVIMGVDFGYDDLEAESSTTTKMPPFYRPSTTSYYYEGNQTTVAGFVQDEWSLHPDFTATFGLRGTWVRSELDKTNDNLETGSDTDSNIVGSIGLVYSGFDNLRLRANFGQGYKQPLLNQMYIGTMHGSSGLTHPNPDLDPEKAWSTEVGVRYENSGFSADLAAFYTKADNYITTQKYLAGGPNDSRFENVNKATTTGAELELGYLHEGTGLKPYTSLTYTRREFDYGSGHLIGKTTKTETSPFTGKVGLKFEREINDFFSLHADLNTRFGSRSKYEYVSGTQILVDENPGWATANFSIGAELGEKRNYFVDLQLNNLFDKAYTTARATHEDPGFHAVVRVGAEF